MLCCVVLCCVVLCCVVLCGVAWFGLVWFVRLIFQEMISVSLISDKILRNFATLNLYLDLIHVHKVNQMRNHANAGHRIIFSTSTRENHKQVDREIERGKKERPTHHFDPNVHPPAGEPLPRKVERHQCSYPRC